MCRRPRYRSPAGRRESVASFEFFAERERRNDEAFAEIELVRARTLRPGIELDATATALPRELFEEREQRVTNAPRAQVFIGDQVVDVEFTADMCVLETAKHRDAGDAVLVLHNAHLAARGEYGEHLAYVVGRDLRAQLPMDRLRTREPLRVDQLPVVVGDADDFHERQTTP